MMKMYDGVLQRVRQIEQKKGIYYANTNGMLYKVLKFILIAALIYTVGVNLILILGGVFEISSIHHGVTYKIDGKEYTLYETWELAGEDAEKIEDNILKDSGGLIINGSICTVLLIAGVILNRFKFYIAGAVTNIAPAIYSIFYFKHRLTDSGGVVSLNAKFYWCHLIPLALIAICMLCITVIAVRANWKTQKQYKKVTENLFEMYNVSLSEGGTLTDEQWDEFLKKYDPDVDYKKQLTTAEETDEG